ncbi:DUF2637 domain-containing protein [Plantactinospora sp. KLBMP9567]|uniref:DUF2637 domain-containing protein n=1 Tax=Plantactinospora sp. KLBMP9567 TaxID=3085900 RepID=UPI0029829E82|nr:DUF2637 domain-containing protein [Plantactinospora sp. KLBMP9567]MDW5324261.1 DUF2637 domain-containing protein [Plantactinospora sp. KLBMP9567]
MSTRTDKALRMLTALTVAALAIVAGAISFSHMAELAVRHGQTGWKAYAFPISVDGLEIVASLYLVAQRRAGRPTGWVPWVALVVGTLASLAANIAVGGHDPVGKALAGWPAPSMLVSVKLLFSMIDHGEDDQRTAGDDQRTAADRPSVPGTVRQTGPDGGRSSRPTADERTAAPGPSANNAADRPTGLTRGRPTEMGSRPAPVDVRPVAHLLPAARAARAMLATKGRSLSRDALADVMRDDGHGVSNERASLLLKILRAEQETAPLARRADRADEWGTAPAEATDVA